MKRMILLASSLLLIAGVALAGTQPLEVQDLGGGKTLVFAQPEGVKSAAIEDVYGMKIVTFELEDASMPDYVMVVSYSDALEEQDLPELSEEQIAELVALTAADSETHHYQMVEMADGWPAVLVQYEGGSDWVDAFTVISGYFIQIHGAHEDFAELTEAEDTYAFTLLDCVDIVES